MSDKRVLAMARKAAADSDDEEISDSGDLDFVSVKVPYTTGKLLIGDLVIMLLLKFCATIISSCFLFHKIDVNQKKCEFSD